LGLLLLVVGVALYQPAEPQLWYRSDGRITVDESVYVTILSECFMFVMLILNRLAVHIINSDKLGSTRISYLVLRSFAFDVVEFRDQTLLTRLQRWLGRTLKWVPFIGDHATLALSASQFGFTFESLMREGLETGSVVAATVHNPAWKTIPPVIGTILKVRRNEDWTTVVRTALSVSSVVIALPGSSEGLRVELKLMRSGGISYDQLLIPVPQTLETGFVDAFSSLLTDMGFDLSQGTLRAGGLYAFSASWAAIEVACGIETAEEAAKEIRAWTQFKSRPEPKWCEFDSLLVEPTPLGRCPSCGLILDPTRVDSVWPDMGFRGRVWFAEDYGILSEMSVGLASTPSVIQQGDVPASEATK